MLADTQLPDGVAEVRTTPAFDADTVPAGLLRAHRLGDDVWGVLRVHEGSVLYVDEESGDDRLLAAGASQVIEPRRQHHVELGDDAAFSVTFYR